MMKKTLFKYFLIVGCVFLSICFFSPSAYPYTDSGRIPAGWDVWSCWYWPYHDDYDPNLYDDGEAMNRYDWFVYYKTREDPNSQGWEDYYHGMPQYPDSWWGHCHAWAGAAVWEAEPSQGRKLKGIKFRIRDRKGLMIESYFNCADGNNFELYANQPSPGLFWRYLRKEIKGVNPMHGHGMAFVGELYYGDEVWNYPIWKYKVTYGRDDDGLYGTMKIFVAADGDPSYADSTTLYYQTFEYEFWGVQVASGKPIDSGYWIGNGSDSRPDAIWRPEYATSWTTYLGNEYLEGRFLGKILNEY